MVKRILISIFITIILVSCATQMPPSGGDRDTTPPRALSYNPANNSTNIKSNEKVLIAFDEFFELFKLNEQLVVSPPVKKNPVISVKGKKLEIRLPDSLNENTTYNIFLGDAIKNIKEGLMVQNFSFSFSTGSYIDSMVVMGNVYQAFNNKPAEGVYVMLYKDTCDTVGNFQKPYYLAKTKSDGSYQLSNLSDGSYRIFAIKDLDGNYMFNQPEEDIAFLKQTIKPHSIITYPDSIPDSLRVKFQPTNLYLFREKYKKQAIVSSGAFTDYKIQTTVRNPIKNPILSPLNGQTGEIFIKPSQDKDTIVAWLNNFKADTLFMAVKDGETTIDTARFYLSKVRKTNDSVRLKSYLPIVNISGQQAFFSPFTISFPFPIQKGDLSKVKIMHHTGYGQTTKIDTIRSKSEWIDSAPYSEMLITTKFEEREIYSVFIPVGTFTNIYGMVNDTLNYSFTTTQSRSYGALKLEIKNPKNKYLIVQLLNSSDKVLEEKLIQSDTTLNYPFLTAASYKVKAVEDLNHNGKWDTGDYGMGILPEKVFYLNDTINIRTNWDVNWKWILE